MTSGTATKLPAAPVCYLAGEGGGRIEKCFQGWRAAHGNPTGGQFIYDKRGHILDDEKNPEAEVQYIIDFIKSYDGFAPALIAIDPVFRFMSGNENAATDVARFMKACERLQDEFRCAVLLSHHAGLGENAQGRARGSSAWRAAQDVEINVRPQDPANIKNGFFYVEETKSKDDAPAPVMLFERTPIPVPGFFNADGEQETTVVIKKADDDDLELENAAKVEKSIKHENIAIRSFQEAALKYGELDDKGNFKGLHIDHWRKAYYALSMADGNNAKRMEFNHVRDKMGKAGRLTVENDRYHLTGMLAIFETEIVKELRNHQN